MCAADTGRTTMEKMSPKGTTNATYVQGTEPYCRQQEQEEGRDCQAPRAAV